MGRDNATRARKMHFAPRHEPTEACRARHHEDL